MLTLRAAASLALSLAVALVDVADGRKGGVLHHLPLLNAGRLVVEITRLEQCDVPDNAIHFANVRMGMLGKVEFVISADVNLTRDGVGLREVHIELTKCTEAVTSNTCEYFQTWRFKDNLCTEWNNPRRPWAAALGSVQPRPLCPLKQGYYEIRNGTVDMKVLQMLPIQLEGSIWLLRVTMWDDSKVAQGLHFCTVAEMEPHRVRD